MRSGLGSNISPPLFLLLLLGGGKIISTSASPTRSLPQALPALLHALEADHGEKHSVIPVTALFSRSVSSASAASAVSSVFPSSSADAEAALGSCYTSGSDAMVVSVPDSASTAAAVGSSGALALFVHSVDSARGEGLFGSLGPILERSLRSGVRRKIAVILLPGASEEAVEAAARRLVASMSAATPEGEKISHWNEAADVSYHVLDAGSSPAALKAALADASVDAQSAERSALAGLSSAASEVASVRTASSSDVATIATLAFPSRDDAVRAVADSTKNRSNVAVPPLLLLDFGARVDAVLAAAMEKFDALLSDLPASVRGSSSLVAARRKELTEDILGRIHGTIFDGQVRELALACEESFRKEMAKLRITPNLPSDMDRCVTDAEAEYRKKAPGLIPRAARWDAAGGILELGPQCRDYVKRKLAAATLQGSYRPAPRKLVSLGFHYLMPEGPFADDYRRPNDRMVTEEGEFVYTPIAKRSEVGVPELKSWGRKIMDDGGAGTLPGASGNTANYMVKMGAGLNQ
eukprot:CAMPEP_0113320078 /NCGR_PEP_ID=MMETSP0010_2-20120614/14019_1 /TAXON_ID=216773 ORGANISM="Corethron hystrix, Strain 308" /NCGR_SAMPLE_ID=MMETSP0010_2 /ASSEMBLY_ACC=CAM_ASM_000155 /LENGTH=523 /DNA_ID=CAMNT_0000177765 /DNA_START=61 /DNA_END=1633 /DNA_ORIENTATION=+ /assembly_acc=CAM_ASM_000155